MEELELTCLICGKTLKSITNTHLKSHYISTNEYRRMFSIKYLQSTSTRSKRAKSMKGKKPWNTGKPLTEEYKKRCGFGKYSRGRKPSELSKLKSSLSHKGQIPWIKGLTKETDPRVAKLALSLSKSKKGLPSKIKGIPFTEEHKRKIGIGNKGKIRSEECREKIRIRNLNMTEEHRNKIREKTTERILSGWEGFTHSKGGHFYSDKNKKLMRYKSSYELTAFQILEQLSIVEKYEYEPFYIEYKDNNSIKRYIPDILIYYNNGNCELIEVKPKNLLKYGNTYTKLEAAKQYASKNNTKFSVWTEEELYRGIQLRIEDYGI